MLKNTHTLTCVGEAAKKVAVQPLEAQEASRERNWHVPTPHTGAPSAPAARMKLSHHAGTQSHSWLKFPVERSICTPVLAAAGLFDQWPERKTSPPLLYELQQPPTTSLTHWKTKSGTNPTAAFLFSSMMPLGMWDEVISAFIHTCMVSLGCETKPRKVGIGGPECVCSPAHLGWSLHSKAPVDSHSDACWLPHTLDSPFHPHGHTHDP